MTSSEQQPRAPLNVGEGSRDAKQHPPTNSTEALEAIARIIDGWAFDLDIGPGSTWSADQRQMIVQRRMHARAKAATILSSEALASTYREENERLRLALLGGEDAPGYAASLTLDQVLKSHRAYMQQVRDAANYDADRLREENARLREGLEEIAEEPRSRNDAALQARLDRARRTLALTTPRTQT